LRAILFGVDFNYHTNLPRGYPVDFSTGMAYEPWQDAVCTNHGLELDLPRSHGQIAALYKSRWQVELFFKWIKQHLKIKKFYGTSKNAVETQIWCAIATYVLIAICQKGVKNKFLALHLFTDFVSVSF
jgi:IS4 transposase